MKIYWSYIHNFIVY